MNIEVPLADIAALMAREIGYDLIPVVTADWNELQKDNLQISIAYTLSAQPDSIYVSSTILPRPGYYELTRNAAKQYGSQFESLWFSSTYMGDSVTPIDIWEQLVKSGDHQTLVCTP